MKKNGIGYFLTLMIILLYGLGVIVLDNPFTRIILAAVGILTAVIWILYFLTIKYEINDEILTIKSGIFFKKTKIIPLKKILLKSSYSVGKTVFLTIIRTAGSLAVIYGEL